MATVASAVAYGPNLAIPEVAVARRIRVILDTSRTVATAESDDVVTQRLSECGQLRGELLGWLAEILLESKD
ncbi:hypothetical protein [Nocardia sp. NBC_00511]|uniref:hypothetical protein n=1 Tax=Nocardia sp. NBC_00511 TaxID=2903591 RepID=UPI0030E1B1FE